MSSSWSPPPPNTPIQLQLALSVAVYPVLEAIGILQRFEREKKELEDAREEVHRKQASPHFNGGHRTHAPTGSTAANTLILLVEKVLSLAECTATLLFFQLLWQDPDFGQTMRIIAGP